MPFRVSRKPKSSCPVELFKAKQTIKALITENAKLREELVQAVDPIETV